MHLQSFEVPRSYTSSRRPRAHIRRSPPLRCLFLVLGVIVFTEKIPPKHPEDGLEAVNASALESNDSNGRSELLNAISIHGVVCRRPLQTRSASAQSFSYFKPHIAIDSQASTSFSYPGYVLVDF
jgi:hypothetical protein